MNKFGMRTYFHKLTTNCEVNKCEEFTSYTRYSTYLFISNLNVCKHLFLNSISRKCLKFMFFLVDEFLLDLEPYDF